MYPASVEELERLMARKRSYVNAAVIVFILYWFAFVPGIIANVIYWIDACRMEDTAGVRLPGVGCLGAMLAGGIALTIAAGAGIVYLLLGGRF